MSFDELYNTCQGEVWAIAYNLLKNSHTAHDVVQDAFLKLWVNWDSITKPKAWVSNVARNRALDLLRRKRATGLPQDLEAPVYKEYTELYEALNKLQPKDRILLEGYYLNREKSARICSKLGIKGMTLYNRLRRARIRLQEILNA